MKDVGIIGSADGPTSVFISSDNDNFLQSGGIVEEDSVTNVEENSEQEESTQTNVQEERMLTYEELEPLLESKTMSENLEAGLKIMGIGMVAVFGVLTILYLVIKLMGQFAKNSKDKENNNEKN